jgi:flagellar protein FlgJ
MIKATQIDNSNDLAMDVQGVGKLRNLAQQNSPQALKESAKQFEALFINMMLQSMRQATPQGGLFESHDKALYTSMYDQQLSQTLANRGMGLADMLLGQLNKNNPDAATGLTKPHSTAYVAPAVLPQIAQSNLNSAILRQLANSMPMANIDENPFLEKTAAVKSDSVPSSVQDFRNKMQAHAQQAQQLTGIPASYILAQAAMESGWGQREITMPDGSSSHNLFGIKAGSDWKGKVAEVTTTEYTDGIPRKVVAKFRAYSSDAEAFRDYAALLNNSSRYEKVIANGQTAQGFAQGLQKAGYATDPAYATKLLKIIQRVESA